MYCVAGNHGRTTRKPRSKFYAQYNLDWLAYKMIADHTKELENVTLLPHLGSATYETRTAMGLRVKENLDAFFETGRPKDPVV